ncbi:sugar kinase [Desulfobulbus sp.]|uniref:sugar kinase n=1 Tax=Desulfobulbus sp. TaxID=895 RepID=UPI00286F052E|nr:sugar kinase [Desulfobulbus sp.]
MAPQTENKIVLIVRATRLDELVARYNTEAQARFYIEHLGADFSDYQQEDAHYKAAVRETREYLQELGRVQVVDRSFVPNFIFGAEDTVVVLGQDGLVANTLKYLDRQPVIGVNPDPARWDGVLLPFRVRDLGKLVPEVFRGGRDMAEVTMARAELSDGQVLHAVNDLFIGARSHISARYLIESGGWKEQHSSSGVIVSTGLGATGWFRSLMTGALAIAASVNEEKASSPALPVFPKNADYLYFTVREPFPSTTSQANLVFGKVTANKPLVLSSQMAGSGVIFSDGMEKDCLEFNSGAQALVRPAAKKGYLVV